MKIFIRTFSAFGNSSTFSLECDENASVKQLKELIQKRIGIAPNLQVLKAERCGVAVIMCDEWPLTFFEVGNGAIITLQKLTIPVQVPKTKNVIATDEPKKGVSFGDPEPKKGVTFGDSDQKMKIPKLMERLGITPSGGRTSLELDTGILSTTGPQTQGQKIESLLTVAKTGDIKMFKEILAEGETISLDSVGVGGWNCLHFASYSGHAKLVELLLSQGVNPNLETCDMWTPLQLACSQGHEEVTSLLLNLKTIEVDRSTSKRGTALHCAAARSQKNIVTLLLRHNANCNIRNRSRQYALDVAVNPEIMVLLKGKTKRVSQAMRSPENVPKRPEKKHGWLCRAGALIINDNKRYFVLDPVKGDFIRYRSKNDFPNKPREVIPLTSILQCRRIYNNWFQKGDRAYFEVVFESRHILSSDTETEANQWVHAISDAIKYHQYIEEQNRKKFSKVITILNKKDGPRMSKSQTHSPNNMASPRNGASRDTSPRQISNKEIAHLDPLPSGGHSTVAKSNTARSDDTEASSTKDRKTEEIKVGGGSDEDEFDQINMRDHGDSVAKPPETRETVNFKSFELLKLLGEGAFGKVFLVKKKSDNKTYAMKVLRKHYLNSLGQLPYAVSECYILKTINHPYIVKLHYAFQTPHNLYMVIDFCSGGDLSYHLQLRQRFEEGITKLFIAETLLAIEKLHDLDIIYRDMKPENLLLDDEGHIKLADFGLAKEGLSDQSTTATFCGSPAYLAPEMVARKGVGKSADLYQIGAIMYEFLTGIPPFYNDDVEKLLKNIKKGKLKFPGWVSKPAKNLIKKLLSKNPDERVTKDEMKRDPWFADIDWKKLERRQITPPMVMRQQRTGTVFPRRPSWTDEDYNQVMLDQDKLLGLVVDEFDY